MKEGGFDSTTSFQILWNKAVTPVTTTPLQGGSSLVYARSLVGRDGNRLWGIVRAAQVNIRVGFNREIEIITGNGTSTKLDYEQVAREPDLSITIATLTTLETAFATQH